MGLAVARSVKRKGGYLNRTSEALWSNQPRAAKVSSRSVFEVGGARLAIGRFDRPLADEECHSLKRAWERARLPEVEDFEVSSKQVSFLVPALRVDSTWRSIDMLLVTSSLAKAS